MLPLSADIFLSVLHTVSTYSVPRNGEMAQDRYKNLNTQLFPTKALNQTMQPKCTLETALQCREMGQKEHGEAVRCRRGPGETSWRAGVCPGLKPASGTT